VDEAPDDLQDVGGGEHLVPQVVGREGNQCYASEAWQGRQ